MNYLYEKANLIGLNKSLLLKRFKEYISCLKDDYRDKFKLDFENKRMIGDKYILQWVNDGITSVGKVFMYKKDLGN